MVFSLDFSILDAASFEQRAQPGVLALKTIDLGAQRLELVNVLRDAMCVDALEPCGVYFGTTGGQVYASADGGDSWVPIVRDLPAVLSVEAQTLP